MMNDSGQLNDTLLDGKRSMGDPDADSFIHAVFADTGQKSALQQWLNRAGGNDELPELSKLFPGNSFIENAGKLPEWADRELMKNGSIFFNRHSEMIMSLLGLLSLPYCYNAADGAMVLYLSEKIRNNTTQRLYDTAVFVWHMMAPDAFCDQGKGFKEALKVRLIHAAVRFHLLKSGTWDKGWGLPVNQEDMAGTNLSFSLIVIRGLRLLGFSISAGEQQGFLHLWNVIGSLTGLATDLITGNAKMAQQLDRAISRRHFRTSVQGRELTRSLTTHILAVNNSRATRNDILGLMRYLLGPALAGQLGIEAPDLPRYKLNLLRTLNLLSSFGPKGDPVSGYQRAYQAFLSQKTIVIK